MSTACPICTTTVTAKRAGTPYWTCPGCGAWFQHPAPPKRYFGPHEPHPEQMSDGDKAANAALAASLFHDVMKGKPGLTLDIGSRYPFLAHTLAGFGCDAWGMEPGAIVHDLNVYSIVGDLEEDRREFKDYGHVRLITLIHVFEHLYNPVEAIRTLRRMIHRDGRVFLRLPDYNVEGFERDLHADLYTIHPFFHSLSSVAECLARAVDCFVIESYTTMRPGQSNIVLRPISERPTIGLGMIVKNEERDLPRLLKSIEGIADGGVILDTGSTDGTGKILNKLPDTFAAVTYIGASELVYGDWKLINFAKARNEYVRAVAEDGYDWLLWMDADDELLTPLAVNRARYFPPWAIGMWMDLGHGIRQVHYRMWPTSTPIHFEGWCHEYPVLGDTYAPVMNDICIRHDAAPGIGETSNARNMRILEKQYEAEPSARCAFYLANTHKDGGRNAEAVKWYNVRLGYGDAFRDEYLFTLLYLARSLRALGQREACESTLTYALHLAPDWAEFRMELAFLAYAEKDYKQAIEHCTLALDRPPPATVLWREKDKYRDQPARLISWSHQLTGDKLGAFAWSEVAANRIVGADLEWSNRHRGLADALHAKEAPAFVTRARRKVALVRPGAIGDILITLNLLPAFRAANPETDIHYFCAAQYAATDALGSIILQAGADLAMDCNGLPAWRKSYDKVIDLVGYPLAEGYPDKPMRRHLLEYFAEEMGLPASMPQLTLPRPPLPFTPPADRYCTYQSKAGWSKYKEWAHNLWSIECPAPMVPISDQSGLTLSQSIALFANATMHVGIDSFCNHLTNYLWTDEHGARRVPGVILWGSTQASAAGYPDNTNISLGLPCQPCFRENPEISRSPRGPCVNPPRSSYADNTPWACMSGIGVEQVADAVREMWERVK
jgi:glycosyltransferase involved in cell wall biosynthesis